MFSSITRFQRQLHWQCERRILVLSFSIITESTECGGPLYNERGDRDGIRNSVRTFELRPYHIVDLVATDVLIRHKMYSCADRSIFCFRYGQVNHCMQHVGSTYRCTPPLRLVIPVELAVTPPGPSLPVRPRRKTPAWSDNRIYNLVINFEWDDASLFSRKLNGFWHMDSWSSCLAYAIR